MAAAIAVLAAMLLAPEPAAAQQGCAQLRNRMNQALNYARRGHNPAAQYAAAQQYRNAIQAYCTGRRGGGSYSGGGSGGNRAASALTGVIGIVGLMSSWAAEAEQKAAAHRQRIQAYEQKQAREQARLQAEAARKWQEEVARQAEINRRKAAEEARRAEQARIDAGRRNAAFTACDTSDPAQMAFNSACKNRGDGPFKAKTPEDSFRQHRRCAELKKKGVACEDAHLWDSVAQRLCREVVLAGEKCIPDDFRKTLKSLKNMAAIHIKKPNAPDYMSGVLSVEELKQLAATGGARNQQAMLQRFAKYRERKRRGRAGGGRKSSGGQQKHDPSGIISTPWAEPPGIKTAARAPASNAGVKKRKARQQRYALARFEAGTVSRLRYKMQAIRKNKGAILDRIKKEAAIIARTRNVSAARHYMQIATALGAFGGAEKSDRIALGATQDVLANLALSTVGRGAAAPSSATYCGEQASVYYPGDTPPLNDACEADDALVVDLTIPKQGIELLEAMGYRHDGIWDDQPPNAFNNYGLPDPVTLAFIQEAYDEYFDDPDFAKIMIEQIERATARY